MPQIHYSVYNFPCPYIGSYKKTNSWSVNMLGCLNSFICALFFLKMCEHLYDRSVASPLPSLTSSHTRILGPFVGSAALLSRIAGSFGLVYVIVTDKTNHRRTDLTLFVYPAIDYDVSFSSLKSLWSIAICGYLFKCAPRYLFLSQCPISF